MSFISYTCCSISIQVESILIKDIQFTKSLQESLSSAAQAKRLAESKVIQAQSEVDSAKLMRQAAECKLSFYTSHYLYLYAFLLYTHLSNASLIPCR